MMPAASLDPERYAEALEQKVFALQKEVRELSRQLGVVQADLLSRSQRWSWEHWARKILGIHLGIAPQYAPRPMQLPKHYFEEIPLLEPAPKISIVTPSYNQGAFLERTLRSVLDQNYPNLEYAVQDGGSSDDSMEIVERYRSQLARAVSVRDKGQAHAINLGHAQLTGEILAYLNSDDILLPGSLAYVARYFQEHPDVDVVYGQRILIDEHDRETGRWILPAHDGKVLSWADFIPQETLFWRRRVWDKIGARFDDSLQFVLDWDLLVRLRDAGAKMVRLPRYLGAFRVHAVQKSQAQSVAVGTREMDALRFRCHGRRVSRWAFRFGVLGFVIKHALVYRLTNWGILRY